MQKIKKARFLTLIFLILLGLIIWASMGIFSRGFSITSFWGIGIGCTLALIFAGIMLGRSFGYIKGLAAVLAVTLTVSLALILNSARGWPFGMAFYHGILGWKMFGVAWPIPIFWSSIIIGGLMLKKPAKINSDPKQLFSWAFDSAIITMAISFIIEPLAKAILITTWPIQGAVLGVPFSAFLGWFITGFIATVIGILILQPWKKPAIPPLWILPFAFLSLAVLTLILATKLNLVLIQIFSAILIIVFLLKTLRLRNHQNLLLIDG